MLTEPYKEQRKGQPQRSDNSGNIIVENIFPLNPFKKWSLIAIFIYCSFLSLLVLFGWWTPQETMTATDGVFLASWFIMPACGAIMLSGERQESPRRCRYPAGTHPKCIVSVCLGRVATNLGYIVTVEIIHVVPLNTWSLVEGNPFEHRIQMLKAHLYIISSSNLLVIAMPVTPL